MTNWFSTSDWSVGGRSWPGLPTDRLNLSDAKPPEPSEIITLTVTVDEPTGGVPEIVRVVGS